MQFSDFMTNWAILERIRAEGQEKPDRYAVQEDPENLESMENPEKQENGGWKSHAEDAADLGGWKKPCGEDAADLSG